jgi:hypothetical protein
MLSAGFLCHLSSAQLIGHAVTACAPTNDNLQSSTGTQLCKVVELVIYNLIQCVGSCGICMPSLYTNAEGQGDGGIYCRVTVPNIAQVLLSGLFPWCSMCEWIHGISVSCFILV